MSKNTSKPNSYWLQKMKLWFVLHGGVKNIKTDDLCQLCRFYQEGITSELVQHISGIKVKVIRQTHEFNCKRKNEMRGRLVANKALTKIEYKDNLYGSDICAEWVKDV